MEMIKKEVFIKELGKGAILTLSPEVSEAISKNWESLYFSKNDISFGSLVIGEYMFALETDGDVRLSMEGENGDVQIYTNNDQDKIREIIDADKLEDYYVGMNNWFSITICKANGKTDEDKPLYEGFDNEVFEACPSSVQELEKVFIDYAVSMMKHYTVV